MQLRKDPIHNKLNSQTLMLSTCFQCYYNEMVNEFPNLKCVLPEPPILSQSYLTYVTLWFILVLLNLLPIDLHLTAHHVYLNEAGLQTLSLNKHYQFYHSHPIHFTSRRKCNTNDTIQAAECTKHKLIYIGHS